MFKKFFIPFELERFVDEDGNQIQTTSHEGARPINSRWKRSDRLMRVWVVMRKRHREMGNS